MPTVQNTYFVSEIFESIQGEGNYAGVNSLFIRFQYCNLTCTWCDTKYTWWKNSGDYKEYPEESLKAIIRHSKPFHIIFTGGEPSLYRLDKLVVEGKKFHVETNGTIIPTIHFEDKLVDGTQFIREAMDENVIGQFNWVVSPKLTNSKQKINEDAIDYWTKQTNCIFKFVIRSNHDLIETSNFVNKNGISNSKVYISLEGKTLQSQIQPLLVEEIIKYGYNFSPRLHVMLWGAERGK
jgi:7-carboxy-7-deazaguanine synthase